MRKSREDFQSVQTDSQPDSLEWKRFEESGKSIYEMDSTQPFMLTVEPQEAH